ncbi:hypothetical protein Bbelb_243380 [Branchiostoma belcheri]|nr:hypothetical protein Bbelb_243380 [Branchiostoma belcheri]
MLRRATELNTYNDKSIECRALFSGSDQNLQSDLLDDDIEILESYENKQIDKNVDSTMNALKKLKETSGTNFRGLDAFLKKNETVVKIVYTDADIDQFMKNKKPTIGGDTDVRNSMGECARLRPLQGKPATDDFPHSHWHGNIMEVDIARDGDPHEEPQEVMKQNPELYRRAQGRRKKRAKMFGISTIPKGGSMVNEVRFRARVDYIIYSDRESCTSTDHQLEDGGDLECVWVQLRPHWLPRSVSSIALCAVYHPPNSTRDDVLLEFLADSVDDVCKQYPGAGIVILGDFNRLDVSTICSEHSLKPVVKVPTRGNVILDQVFASDAITQWYQPPTVDPPIGASDHNCVIWSGSSSSGGQNRVVKKVVRPLRQSDVQLFGSWITEHDWEEVYSEVRATDKCSAFYSTLSSAIEKHFPSKIVRLHERDKPWMTPALKAMILLRQKAFREHNLPEVKRLRNKISHNIKLLKTTFYRQKIQGLKKADPRKWYRAIKDMGNMGKGQLNIDIPGVSPVSTVDVAKAINTYLAAASQKHEPLRLHDLPAYLPAPAPPPTVSVWDM